jgi:hypothetical protein
MTELTGTFDKQRECISNMDIELLSDSSTDKKLKYTFRAELLLLRSIISTLSTVVFSISAFCHPYLKKILISLLSLHSQRFIPGVSGILDEISTTLPNIVRKITPRLFIPSLLTATVELTELGHPVAKAFALLLSDVFRNLERLDVTTHLGDLCSMTVLFLDYRRVYGDGSVEVTEVEEAVSESLVELSVKMTETELRSFLSRLDEWKDVDMSGDNDNDDSTTLTKRNTEEISGVGKKPAIYSRGASLYLYLGNLGEKLKVIFTPLIGPFWDHIAQISSEFVSLTTQLNDAYIAVQPRSVKKRRKSQESDTDNSLLPSRDVPFPGSNEGLKELGVQLTRALRCVKLACSYDEGSFVDEVLSHLLFLSCRIY